MLEYASGGFGEEEAGILLWRSFDGAIAVEGVEFFGKREKVVGDTVRKEVFGREEESFLKL